MSLRLALLCAALASAGAPALAQHGQHGSAPPASPYAGQQSRDIKALSEKEVKDLLDGAGMGFAKAAELNRYPGPAHALEHAERLGLSSAQREGIEAIVKRHRADAKRLGARVLELERELDTIFASGKATTAAVDRLAAALGEVNGRLRAEHLKTHLETTDLLTAAQVASYVEVRGYSADGGGGGTHRH